MKSPGRRRDEPSFTRCEHHYCMQERLSHSVYFLIMFGVMVSIEEIMYQTNFAQCYANNIKKLILVIKFSLDHLTVCLSAIRSEHLHMLFMEFSEIAYPSHDDEKLGKYQISAGFLMKF